ncbi:MAG: phage tail protein [Desulfitobacteriaceae bacterium]
MVRNILIRVGADIRGYQRNMSQVQHNTRMNMLSVAGSLAIGRAAMLAFGAAAVAAFAVVGKNSIKMAMDVVESESLFAVSMGSMANAARAWSEELQSSLGLNAYEVRKNVGVFYNMTTSMGLTRAAAYKLSTDLTKLAYDMSSFYNMDVEEMFIKLQSGITGETEPLKRIGILVLDNVIKQYAYAEGIANVGEELTEQQKVMARYIAIMNQTRNAQGDLARTIMSPTNQLRILKMQLDLARINLGNAFMPIVTIVLPILTSFAKGLVRATNTFAQFMLALFGAKNAQTQTAQSAADAAAAQTSLGNAAKKAGDKAKRGVAGFDQLNMLQEALAGSAGDAADALEGGDSTMPTPDKQSDGKSIVPQSVIDAADRTKAALASLKQTAGEVSQYLQGAFGPPLLQAFNAILPVAQAWKTSLVDTFQQLSTLGAPFKAWLTGNLVPLMQQVIVTVGNIAAGVGDSLLLVFNSVRSALFPIIERFVINGLPLLTSFASGAVTVFKAFFDYAKFVFDTLWQGVVDPAMQLISHIVLDGLNIIKGFWDKYGDGIITGLVATFNTMKDLFDALWKNFLAPIVKGLTNELTWLWDNHIKGVVQAVADLVGKLITGALEIYNGFIAPIVKYLIELFGPGFANAFTFVTGIIGTFIGVIADVAKGLFKILGGIIDFITGVFTGNWGKAWDGVKEIFGGIWDGVSGIFKGGINLIIDAINAFTRTLNWIPQELSKVPGFGWAEDFQIPEIPKLANGGLISAPTLAMIGDNKNAHIDPEVISPLSKLQDMIDKSISTAMVNGRPNNSGGDTTVILQLGETELGRAVIKAINSVQRQAGMTLIEV